MFHQKIEISLRVEKLLTLTAKELKIDFRDGAENSGSENTKMGYISANKLKQFYASKDVYLKIHDDNERLEMFADKLNYEKDNQLIIVSGTPQKDARIEIEEDGNIINSRYLDFRYDLSKKQLISMRKPQFGN